MTIWNKTCIFVCEAGFSGTEYMINLTNSEEIFLSAVKKLILKYTCKQNYIYVHGMKPKSSTKSLYNYVQ
jgi:hypothetical protein